MKLSIIIPTYNRAALLDVTLRACSRQSLARDQFEVIVVDDGSRDETESVASKYEDKLALEYVRQWDRGFRAAGARNLGIAAASNPVCVFIDCGVLLHSTALEVHSKLHEGRHVAAAGYVYGFSQGEEHHREVAELVDPDDVDGSVVRLMKSEKHDDLREEVYRSVDDQLVRLPAPWAIFWSCHTSVRREALLSAGLFDGSFRTWGAEDDDLAFRLQRLDVPFVLARAASSVHYPHSKDETSNRQSGLDNLRRMYGKYQDPIILRRIEMGWDGVNLSERNALVTS
jgi:glycosyltransferase involved in cell wall biosynthesis